MQNYSSKINDILAQAIDPTSFVGMQNYSSKINEMMAHAIDPATILGIQNYSSKINDILAQAIDPTKFLGMQNYSSKISEALSSLRDLDKSTVVNKPEIIEEIPTKKKRLIKPSREVSGEIPLTLPAEPLKLKVPTKKTSE